MWLSSSFCSKHWWKLIWCFIPRSGNPFLASSRPTLDRLVSLVLSTDFSLIGSSAPSLLSFPLLSATNSFISLFPPEPPFLSSSLTASASHQSHPGLSSLTQEYESPGLLPQLDCHWTPGHSRARQREWGCELLPSSPTCELYVWLGTVEITFLE